MSAAIVFKYKRIDGAFRPIVPVEITSPATKNTINHAVLIDSGADWCVINAEIGEALGIKIENDKPHEFKGISGKVETGYVHIVTLGVKGVKFNTPVIFAKALAEDRYSIVGQVGFFDQFDIRFSYKDGKIVLR